MKKMHKCNAIRGSLFTVLKQCFPGVQMRVVRDQAQRRKEVLSSPQFILNNHLSSVNKQVAEQSSKGLFKRHLKNFNCLGFFILKFIKQIFLNLINLIFQRSFKFTGTVSRKYSSLLRPLCPHISTPPPQASLIINILH